MKQISILLLIFFPFLVSAQDLIKLKNNELIKVDVIELNNYFIRYKLENFKDGPIFELKMREIEEITYSNDLKYIAKEQNPRFYRPLGISAGSGFIYQENYYYFYGFGKFSYFITPQLDIEATFGYKYMSAGAKFHINKFKSTNRITPFIGFLSGMESGFGVIQIPVGFSWLCNRGMHATLSFNEIYYFKYNYDEYSIELTLGYRFK